MKDSAIVTAGKRKFSPPYLITACLLIIILLYTVLSVSAQITQYDFPQRTVESIDMEGNRAVVNKRFSNLIEVFEISGNRWINKATITVDYGNASNISISGNRIALTAKGNVVVYDLVNGIWVESGHVKLPDGITFADNFRSTYGRSISLDGDRIVATAFEHDISANKEGHIFVFEKTNNGWEQVYEIGDIFEGPNTYNAVSLSGDQFVINDGYHTQAVIYKYNGTDWQQIAAFSDQGKIGFASALDMQGNRIAVNSTLGYCSIYEYKNSQWKKTAQIKPDGAYVYNNNSEPFRVSFSGNLLAFYTVITGADIAVYELDNSQQWIQRAVIKDTGARNLVLAEKNLVAIQSTYSFFYQLGDFSNPEEQVLVAPDARALASFGESVTVSEDYAVVGAPHDSEKGVDAGAIYIFKKEDAAWKFDRKVTAPNPEPGDQFGFSVDFQTNMVVIVGAPFEDENGENSGTAYICNFGYKIPKLIRMLPKDGAAGDLFGYSVAYNGIAVVGAPHHASQGISKSGAAYIFQGEGSKYPLSLKITPETPAAGDMFGSAVDITKTTCCQDRDRIVVGAPYNDDAASNGGTAYLYTYEGIRNKLVYQSNVYASDPGTNDRFGSAIAAYGDELIVGAPLQCGMAIQAGAAYIFDFKNSQWGLAKKLTASDAAVNDRFGAAVMIQNELAVVGSSYNDPSGGTNAGAMYVYKSEAGQWNEKGKLTGSARTGDRLGYGVGLSGNNLVAGAYHDDLPGLKDAGSLHVFTVYNSNALPMATGSLARTLAISIATKEIGEETLHNPIAGVSAMRIFPNPFSDQIGISLENEADETIEVTLLDALGRVVYQKNVHGQPGWQELNIDLGAENKVRPGLVFLGLKNQAGTSQWFRLLKH